MNHLLLGTPSPNNLYHSSVNEPRVPSSSLYERRPSQGVAIAPKSNNYLIPSNLDQRKNEQLFLRSTVSTNQNVHEVARKNKNQSFLRNHGGQVGNQSKSAKKYEQNCSSGYEGYVRTGIRPFEFKQVNDKRELAQKPNSVNEYDSNFSQILEKLNKKEKIIKQLQKLCEDRVSDNMRKGSFQQKKTENPYSVKVTGYGGEDKNLYLSSVYQSPKQMQSRERSKNGSFRDTTYNEYNQSKNSSKIEELIPPKYEAKKYSETQIKNKNPEEDIFSKEGFNRIKASYLTPKQSKTSDSKQTSRSKIIDFKLQAEQYNNKLELKKLRSNFQVSEQSDPYQKYKYSNEPTYRSSTQIEQSPSPTRKMKDSEEYTKQRKNIKDIRQMMETKNIKSNTSYFSQSKVSIYDFQLKKTLGQGKFGLVYQAFHKQTSSLFALKKISKKIIKENLMVDQLLQQIKIQNFCHHQNILKLYGFFDDHQFIYLILEYMEEGTLFTKLKKQKTLKEEEAAVILKQITKAVIYLHQNGIAHRDIKPQNIVMSNRVGKLCDFGWAAICTDRRKTYCGTFDYVAPEILEGSEYDISVDLWCLGVLAYELMVGKAPFYHISRKETMKKIMNVEKIDFPSHLSKLAVSFIQNLIKKNPEERMNGESLLRHPFLSKVSEVSL